LSIGGKTIGAKLSNVVVMTAMELIEYNIGHFHIEKFISLFHSLSNK